MSAPSRLPAPPDTRPYRTNIPGSASAFLNRDDAGYETEFRQVGTLGQTGAFYSMAERPSLHEGGGWTPMYVPAHTDRMTDRPPAPGRLIAEAEVYQAVLTERCKAGLCVDGEESLDWSLQTVVTLLNGACKDLTWPGAGRPKRRLTRPLPETIEFLADVLSEALLSTNAQNLRNGAATVVAGLRALLIEM